MTETDLRSPEKRRVGKSRKINFSPACCGSSGKQMFKNQRPARHIPGVKILIRYDGDGRDD